MRALLVGWFSFEGMGATAGDLLVKDVVAGWLEEAACPYDVALASPFAGGVDLAGADPAAYTHVVFVCGPFGNGWPVTELRERFGQHIWIGVDLSMLEPLEAWNPFDLLLERDSSRTSRPDVSLVAPVRRVPVLGLVLIPEQPEYGAAGRHSSANDKLEQVAAERECARIRIDTRLDTNQTGLRTAGEVVSLLERVDVVLTTRLHGLVLALRAGIPAVAVDPVAGGAKLTRQAAALGWPYCFGADADPDTLREALDRCLRDDARHAAAAAAERATHEIASVRSTILSYLAGGG